MGPRSARPALLVALLALLPYLALGSAPLVYDAVAAIGSNPVVQQGDVSRVFAVDFWGFPVDSPLTLRSYRPLVTLTWTLSSRHHAIDMALHAIVSAMVVLWLVRLGWGEWAAGAGGLAFAWHPAATEAVCSAVGRADLLAALCLVSALVLTEQAARRPPGRLRLAIALGAIAAAMLCKEYAVVFPFIVTGAGLLRRQRGGPRNRAEPVLWVASFVALAAYLALRFWLFGTVAGPEARAGFHPLHGASVGTRWAVAGQLWALVFRLLLVPIDLNHHYRFGTLDLVQGWLDPRALVGWLLLLALGTGALVYVRRRRDVTPALALLLIALPVSPGLHLVTVAPVVFAERYLYIPAVGTALALVWVVERFLSPAIDRRWISAIVALGLVTAGAWTRHRVNDWRSPESLARSSLAAYPDGSEVWMQLGVSLAAEGRHDEAAEAFSRSVELNPEQPESWQRYADTLEALGRYQASADAWQQVLRLVDTEVPVLLRGAGLAELRAGRHDRALPLLRRVVELVPADRESATGLAQVLRHKHERALELEREGRLALAAAELEQVLATTPDHAPTLFNYGRLLLAAGRAEAAIGPLERGLEQSEDPRARALLERALQAVSDAGRSR